MNKILPDYKLEFIERKCAMLADELKEEELTLGQAQRITHALESVSRAMNQPEEEVSNERETEPTKARNGELQGKSSECKKVKSPSKGGGREKGKVN